MNNPSCIDLIITNRPNSFLNASTFSTGLSDFHKLVVKIFSEKWHLKNFITKIIINIMLMILKLNRSKI